ncbi:MAG: preprotein translocase subunit SecG [Bacteroidota bacterium]|jgi:preprotein translocase subunit SecG
MFGFLIAVEVIISMLLMIAILMQSSKGGGLAGTFGGGNVGMMFGVRRTSDFLIKATQVLALLFGVLALIINILFLPRSESTNIESVLQKSAASQQTAPAPSVPQLPPSSQPSSTPTNTPPTGK